MATATVYWVSADMRCPSYVYIGLQDNGEWGGPSATRSATASSTRTGSASAAATDSRQPSIQPTTTSSTPSRRTATPAVTTCDGPRPEHRPRAGGGGRGGPGGGGGGRGGAFTPNVINATPGEQYRFNWNTPFQLSPHNPSIVWLGGNRLFRSLNRGDTWTASADLAGQIDRNAVAIMGVPGNRTMLSKNDGVVAYSTIVSLSESPVVPGVVWAGTDDGNVQVSRDGGLTFTEVGRNIPGLPANHLYWISRIDASHFDAGTAYVSVDGHRSNDLKPYLFVTRDYGQQWESVSGNLPSFGFVQVVREDPRNRDLFMPAPSSVSSHRPTLARRGTGS